MKRLGQYILFAILPIYLITVYFVFERRDRERVCMGVEIDIVNNDNDQFVDTLQVQKLLAKHKIKLKDFPMDQINTEHLEDILLENRLIEQSECFKTSANTIVMRIHQRIPVLRVMSSNGGYYIDRKGNIMPHASNTAIYLPIASGYITEEFAQESLYPLAQYLNEHKFWNTQIEQIYVTKAHDIELVPRVGSHRIILGTIERLETKLDNLKLFYDKVIPRVGWNKYTTINLKYKRQIVCTED